MMLRFRRVKVRRIVAPIVAMKEKGIGEALPSSP